MYQQEVAPGITFVEGGRRGRFPWGDLLVLEGREARVLVDTGPGEDILAGVLDRGPVDVVINTHYHIDHVRGNSAVSSRFPGAEFWCPAGEKEAFSDWEGFLRFTGLGVTGADRAELFSRHLGWSPTRVSRELRDGDALDFGGLTAEVVSLPGHTPGHMGLAFRRERVLFTADVDFGSFGPWYGDVYSSIEAYLGSLDRIEAAVSSPGGPTMVISAHRRPLTAENTLARLPRFREHFAERDGRILALLEAEAGGGGDRPGLSLTALTEKWPIYGTSPEQVPAGVLPGFYKSERFMTLHHLERLETAGRVRRSDVAERSGVGERAGRSPESEGEDSWVLS